MINSNVFKILMGMLLAGVLVCCGGKDSNTAADTSAAEKTGGQQQTEPSTDSTAEDTQVSTPAAEEQRGKAEAGIIKSITLSPSILRSSTGVEVKVALGDAETVGYSLQYTFWKNNKIIHESDEGVLEKGILKRGDFLMVDVKVLGIENEMVESKRSNIFEVLNSPPLIKNIIIPDIKGFGLYTFNVEAEDADQDTLTFTLEGKDLPQTLQVDSTSGTVTYQFSDPPPEKLSFVLVADDGNGGKAKKSVFMTFKKNNPEQNQSLNF